LYFILHPKIIYPQWHDMFKLPQIGPCSKQNIATHTSFASKVTFYS